jgi:hypothetical protein
LYINDDDDDDDVVVIVLAVSEMNVSISFMPSDISETDN